jgi:hypothetical protein
MRTELTLSVYVRLQDDRRGSKNVIIRFVNLNFYFDSRRSALPRPLLPHRWFPCSRSSASAEGRWRNLGSGVWSHRVFMFFESREGASESIRIMVLRPIPDQYSFPKEHRRVGVCSWSPDIRSCMISYDGSVPWRGCRSVLASSSSVSAR